MPPIAPIDKKSIGPLVELGLGGRNTPSAPRGVIATQRGLAFFGRPVFGGRWGCTRCSQGVLAPFESLLGSRKGALALILLESRGAHGPTRAPSRRWSLTCSCAPLQVADIPIGRSSSGSINVLDLRRAVRYVRVATQGWNFPRNRPSHLGNPPTHGIRRDARDP